MPNRGNKRFDARRINENAGTTPELFTKFAKNLPPTARENPENL